MMMLKKLIAVNYKLHKIVFLYFLNMFKKYKMIEDDYGFYIDLDDNYDEKKNNVELDIIDKYEKKYRERLHFIEHNNKWTFVDGLQCFWFIIQTIIYRYTHKF